MKKLIVLIILLTVGCGGGSTGTGTRELEGRILLVDGTSPVGGTVTAVETGDTAEVSADGTFTVTVPNDSGTLTIEIDGSSTTATVPEAGAEDVGQVVEIVIDTTNNTVDLSGLDVIAKIEGACDIYFENNRTIRQGNRAPQGVTCPLRVRAKKDGVPRGGVPFALEVRDCDPDSEWKEVGSGVTQSAGSIGFGELRFRFFDDEERCVYRVITPPPFKKGVSVVHEILTLTSQKLQ